MGWSGMMLYDAVVSALPTLALAFLVAGGVLYSLGVVFHAWQRLRFQNAIWHGFVLLGAALPLYRRARRRVELSGNKTTTRTSGRERCRWPARSWLSPAAANGIGRAMCEAFHRAGAGKVVVADIDPNAARAVAGAINGAAFKCDVGKEKDILHVIEETEAQVRPDRPVLQQCRHRRRLRSAVGQCRRRFRRALAAEAGPCTSWRMSMRRGIWCPR
jgi:hypothetical protein